MKKIRTILLMCTFCCVMSGCELEDFDMKDAYDYDEKVGKYNTSDSTEEDYSEVESNKPEDCTIIPYIDCEHTLLKDNGQEEILLIPGDKAIITYHISPIIDLDEHYFEVRRGYNDMMRDTWPSYELLETTIDEEKDSIELKYEVTAGSDLGDYDISYNDIYDISGVTIPLMVIKEYIDLD